jgi:hypothetical protein
MEERRTLEFSFGYVFPPNMRYLGYALVVFSGLALIFMEWWAILPLVIGISLCTRSSGTEYCKDSREYREFTKSFFRTSGKWLKVESYTDIAVLMGKEGFTAYSRGMVELNVSEKVFDLYLLKPDHRSRLILKRTTSLEEAEQEGEALAKDLGLNWTAYSPEISERTRARRR